MSRALPSGDCGYREIDRLRPSGYPRALSGTAGLVGRVANPTQKDGSERWPTFPQNFSIGWFNWNHGWSRPVPHTSSSPRRFLRTALRGCPKERESCLIATATTARLLWPGSASPKIRTMTDDSAGQENIFSMCSGKSRRLQSSEKRRSMQ